MRHLKNIEIPLSETSPKHLILTGKNGSGKTSVLEAIRLFLWLVSDSDQSNVVKILENLKSSFDPISYQFKIEKILPKIGDLLKGYQRNNFINDLIALSGVEILMKSVDWENNRIDSENFIIAYYPAERKYFSADDNNFETLTRKPNLKIYDNAGKNFVNHLKNLTAQQALYQKRGDFERANKIQAWLDNLTRTLRDIFSNEKLTLELDIETLKFKINLPDKIPFSFDEMASGYSAIFHIILDLMMRMEKNIIGKKYDMNGIVLIDEVDAHLHLSLQKNILPILKKLFPNLQFIVTTHSPFVLNSVEDVVVYDLSDNRLINSVEGLSNLPYSGIVEGYFGASELSEILKAKFERYKKLAQKQSFSEDDYNELADLENYLDEIPDFLALDIATNYRQIKFELEQREEYTENNG